MERRSVERDMLRMLQSSARERYAYFADLVRESRRLWGLAREAGWALASDSGQELFPVWPHERYAALCASGNWAGRRPRAIELGHWLSAWTAGLARDGRRVAVFPTATRAGRILAAEELARDLRAGLARRGSGRSG